jgi:antitoxin MazE
MRSKIQKWGNSLALRIPKPFAVEAGMDKDTLVEISLKQGKLVISRVIPDEYSLTELLSGVTSENTHREVDFGDPTGKEIW